MKIMYVEFIRVNPWGTSDHATHYYVDGKRISGSHIGQYESYAHKNLKYDRTENYTKMKDGIRREYNILYYV